MASATRRRQRGDGALYRTAAGVWTGAVDLGRGPDGKRRRKTVSSVDYETAVRKMRALRRQVEDGYTATATPTLEAWLRHWLEEIASPQLKPNTIKTYRNASRHIAAHLGRRKVEKVTPANVREMHRALAAAGLSQGTVHQVHRVLCTALGAAFREGLVPRVVTDVVDPPRLADEERGALTVEQATHLLRTAAADGDPFTTRWAAALMLGARQGELLGLTWDRVDLEHGIVDLAWQLQAVEWDHGCDPACGLQRRCPSPALAIPAGLEHRPLYRSLVLTRPKSRRGRRVLPLPAPLVALLKRHRDDLTRVPGDHDLVWTTRDGHPVHPRVDHGHWAAALERAGLPAMPLHSARHTTASLLLAAGVDGRVIQQVLGHSAIATSHGYMHVDLQLARQGMAALDGLLD